MTNRGETSSHGGGKLNNDIAFKTWQSARNELEVSAKVENAGSN
ncbi:hypothetical protein [Roseibacillus ishigakijimensis]|nr:hypothetical protein [Roseibacillus ishigakijimensis]